jgi:hypothetical protein
MGREFITTNIVGTTKAPITAKGLQHINAMAKEQVNALVNGLVPYTTNDIIVLYGCVVAVTSGSIPGTGTATLTAGAVYYNGEIYLVDANGSLSTTNPQTLIWQAVNTLQDGVQTKFTDGMDYDFLSIRKLRLVAGAVGAGLANYDAATVKKFRRGVEFTPSAFTGFTGTPTGYWSITYLSPFAAIIKFNFSGNATTAATKSFTTAFTFTSATPEISVGKSQGTDDSPISIATLGDLIVLTKIDGSNWTSGTNGFAGQILVEL